MLVGVLTAALDAGIDLRAATVWAIRAASLKVTRHGTIAGFRPPPRSRRCASSEGVHGSATAIAEAEKMSYVSRILRLALLAPDLVEAILGGWADQRVVLER